QEPAEVGLRPKITGGRSGVKGSKGSLVRIGGIVARIANVGKRRDAHSHRLGKQRDKIRINHQAVRWNADPAIGKPVQQRRRFVPDLLDLRRAFQPFCLKRADIKSIVVKAGEIQGNVLEIKPARLFIADEDAFLKIAIAGLQGNGVVASTEVKARHVKGNARAGSGAALRIKTTGRL